MSNPLEFVPIAELQSRLYALLDAYDPDDWDDGDEYQPIKAEIDRRCGPYEMYVLYADVIAAQIEVVSKQLEGLFDASDAWGRMRARA